MDFASSSDLMISAAREPRSAPVDRVEAAFATAGTRAARHVFIGLDKDRIRADAVRSQRRWQSAAHLSALDGVPVAIKDNIAEAGVVMTAGSAVLRDGPPQVADAAIVARLKRLGAVPFGRANLSEVAFSGLGLNPHFGTPCNAVDPEANLVPGGSSSGCAVAVALGLVPLALGTDTSGSGRVPAAFNGIVGYRPSRGRYPEKGVFPLAPGLDTPAVLGRAVADCVTLDELLSGEKALPVEPRAELVVPETVVLDGLDPAVSRQFDDALACLANAGFAIRRRGLTSFEWLSEAMARHGTPVTAEAAETLRAYADNPRIDRRVRHRLQQGLAQGPDARAVLDTARQAAQMALAEELGNACMVFPTVPIQPPRIADLEADDAAFARCNALVLRNTMLGSLLDTPAISLPFMSHGRHPIGVQLSMRQGRDRPLLALARAIERHFQNMRQAG
ncbi:MAG: amidase family protein [Roseovarius sp.]